MEFFTSAQLDEIADSIYYSIGYTPAYRKIFFSGVNKTFFALLPVDPIELIQLELDLIYLNKTGRLTDGTIPFESWLEKASRYLKPFPDANKVIQHGLSQVNSFFGSAAMVDIKPPSSKVIDTVLKEKIVHRDDMVSYAFLEGGLIAGNAVARIKVPRYDNGVVRILNQQPATYLGTSWLLTKNLVITNHHVINARDNNEPDASSTDFQSQATNTVVQFDFNADNMAGITSSVAKLEAADEELDYAILRLKDSVERIPLRILPEKIEITSEDVPVVNIIQHPFGYSKKVAIRNNHIYDNHYPKVRYFTDTEGGASGAPVFNDNWEVIALHRASTLVDNVKYNGQLTAWVNEGVQLDAIVSHLKLKNKQLAEEILSTSS